MTQLKTYCSPKTFVKDSNKEGKGFFAKKDIKKDKIVSIKTDIL